MPKNRKSAIARKPSRNPKPLRQLREALQLGDEAWAAFRNHLRAGIADYERDEISGYDDDDGTGLSLANVPGAWFSDPDVFGYVAARILTRAQATLHAPVALHLFRLFDQLEFAGDRPPPGIGLAWLRLAQLGITEELNTGRIVQLPYIDPESFFAGVPAEELPALVRLCISAASPPRAWDIHCLLLAVASARLKGNQTFHVFDALMTTDWLSAEVKREICRGLLDCDPERRRLEQQAKEFMAEFDSTPGLDRPWPVVRHDAARLRLGVRLPDLRRHAVRALVMAGCEPLESVLDEFFGRTGGRNCDMVSEGVLDLVDLYADALGSETVMRWLRRALKKGYSTVRHAAYRIGRARFGDQFIRPALRDDSCVIRQWARKALDAPNKKRNSLTSR